MAVDLAADGLDWQNFLPGDMDDHLLGAELVIHGEVATLCEAAIHSHSGYRMYHWLSVLGGGTISQTQIYNTYPRLRPIVLTCSLVVNVDRIQAETLTMSGERLPAIPIRAQKSYVALQHVKHLIATRLDHSACGLVLLTPSGECVHNEDVFERLFLCAKSSLLGNAFSTWRRRCKSAHS